MTHKNKINKINKVVKNVINKISLRATEDRYSNSYRGIAINFAGRIRGAQRARGLKNSYGTLQSSFISQKQIFSKWGVIGSTVLISR